MNRVIVGIGSNLGNREENMNKAVHALERLPNTTVIGASGLYETKPVEVPNQQTDYLNECVVLLTELSPRALLGACLGIEAAMGRQREVVHDSRTIDIDLLIYEGVTNSDAELMLPHPQMLKRAFVLVPLNEIFANGVALGLDFSAALKRVDKAGVTLF